MVKFGVCTSDFDRIEEAIEAGVDYIEMGVSNTLQPLISDEEFAATRAKVECLAVRPEAFNLFFPGTVRITGPDVDWGLVRHYAGVATARCAQLGGEVMVVGSSGARNVPDGFDWDKAWEQLAQAFRITGKEAAKHDVMIVIEPLRKQESNIVNQVTDGLKLAKEVDHPHVQVLADFYHMDELGEPLDDLLQVGDRLKHVHVADTGRYRPGSGDYDYETFFSYLKEIGYDDRISMEGRWNEGEFAKEVADGLAYLQEKWAAA